MESFFIGIGNLEKNDFELETHSDAGNSTRYKTNKIKDHDLFGNDSNSSDMDIDVDSDSNIFEDIIEGDFAALCVLNCENLTCKINGDNSIFCIRPSPIMGESSLLLKLGNSKENIKKLKMQENDLVIIITGSVNEKRILDIVKKCPNDEEGICINQLTKRISGNLELSEDNSEVVIIASKVKRKI